MPTFQSIPIHPSVKSRFAATGSSHDINSDTINREDDQKQSQSQQQQQQQQLTLSSVETPRALLTRDPQTLVELFTRGQIKNQQQKTALLLVQMNHLRSQVAEAMLTRTKKGRHLLQRQRQRRHKQQQQQQQRRRRPGLLENDEPLVVGASINLLDAWNDQKELIKSQNQSYTFSSTGCKALDELLAFPFSEYKYYDPSGTTICNNDIEGNTITPVVGIPRGYVFEILGSTGKTQLALQMAVQSIIQSCKNTVRYCYSRVGHCDYSLVQRFVQLLTSHTTTTNNNNNNDRRRNKYGGEYSKQIDFQPISNFTQLITTLATLEEGWIQQERSYIAADENSNDTDNDSLENNHHRHHQSPVILIIDTISSIQTDIDWTEQTVLLERKLKRIARQYSVLIIVTKNSNWTSTTQNNNNNNNNNADIQVYLEKETSTMTSLRLIRHPTKFVTEKDCLKLLHTSNFGMTTTE